MNKNALSPFDCDLCAMVEDLTKTPVEVTASPENFRLSWEQCPCDKSNPEGQKAEAIKQAVNGRLGTRAIMWEYKDGRQNVYVEYDPTEYPEEIRTRLYEPDATAGTRYCRTLKEIDAIQVRRENLTALQKFTGGGTMTIPRTPNAIAVYSFASENGAMLDAPETWYIIREGNGRFSVRSKREFDAEFEPKGNHVVGNYEPAERWRLRGANMIVAERQKQISKARTPEHDSKENPAEELTRVAAALALDDADLFGTSGWSWDWWEKIKLRPFTERLAIAGALIAAEIDAQDYDSREKCENCEKELPGDLMLHDNEGVPLCRECYDAIKGDPEFADRPGCGNCANFTNEDAKGDGYCEAFKTEQSCGVLPCQEYKPNK